MVLTESAPTEVVPFAIHFLKSNWLPILVAALVYRAIYLRYFHPLAKFPGPFLASVTDLWELRLFLTGRQNEFELDLHKKYGPVVRIRPNTLLIDDATVLPQTFHKDVDKTPFHKSAGFGFGEATVGQISHKDHARVKKRIAPSYSMTAVRGMEHHIDERINEWILKLDELYAGRDSEKKKKYFDFTPWTNYVAYDVLSDAVFGEHFGFVRTASDVGGLIEAFQEAMCVGGIFGRLHKINAMLFYPPFNMLLPKTTDKKGVGAVMRFRDRLFKERIENGKSSTRRDVLHNMLNAKNADGSPVPHDDVKAEILLGMMAGSDTTGATIRHFILRLAEMPEEYDKVMAEIDALFEKPDLKHKHGIINYDEVVHLPYLQASIRESLRMSPPIPAYLIRAVSEPGLDILGYHIPAGTQVAHDAWVMVKNKKVYGEDAEVYRPDRWLGPDYKRLDKLDFSFGYGSRSCIGKNLASVEYNKAIVTFMRRFKLKIIPKPADAPYGYSVEYYAVWAERGIWVEIERRDVPEWNNLAA